MTEIMKPKVHTEGWVDLIALGVVKQAEERLTSPLIGNGTIVSGAVKGVAGALFHGKAGRIGNIVSGALLVDAGEDLAVAVMGLVGGMGMGGNRSNDEFGG
jgi:hypothetical protein